MALLFCTSCTQIAQVVYRGIFRGGEEETSKNVELLYG